MLTPRQHDQILYRLSDIGRELDLIYEDMIPGLTNTLHELEGSLTSRTYLAALSKDIALAMSHLALARQELPSPGEIPVAAPTNGEGAAATPANGPAISPEHPTAETVMARDG